MKQKLLFALLFVTFLFTVSGCNRKDSLHVSNDTTEIKNPTTILTDEDPTKETTNPIGGTKILSDVTITIPGSFFEGATSDGIIASCTNNGATTVTINEDTSVTVTFTKEAQQTLLSNIKSSLDKTIESLIHGEHKITSYLSITYNNEVTKFTITVDKTAYSSLDSFSALTLYTSGALYQLYNCTPNKQVDVVVEFVDQASGELIDSGSYQEMIAESQD